MEIQSCANILTGVIISYFVLKKSSTNTMLLLSYFPKIKWRIIFRFRLYQRLSIADRNLGYLVCILYLDNIIWESTYCVRSIHCITTPPFSNLYYIDNRLIRLQVAQVAQIFSFFNNIIKSILFKNLIYKFYDLKKNRI